MNLIQSQSCWWESLRTVYKAWRVLVSMTNAGASSLTPWSSVKDQEQGAYVWLDPSQAGPASLYNLINSDWISSPRNIVVSFLLTKVPKHFNTGFVHSGFVCLSCFHQKKRKWSVNKRTLWRDVGGVSDDRSARVQQPLRKASGCEV